MKVSVTCSIVYNFETEIDDTIDGNPVSLDDIVFLVDCADSVYQNLGRLLSANHLNHDGTIISIADANTGEILWAE